MVKNICWELISQNTQIPIEFLSTHMHDKNNHKEIHLFKFVFVSFFQPNISFYQTLNFGFSAAPRRSITSTLAASEDEEEETGLQSRLNRRATTVGLTRTSKFAVVTALSLVSATSSSAKTYSSIRTSIIKITPETMKCKLYCRGSNCRYCSWKSWTKEQMAIDGLYSSW